MENSSKVLLIAAGVLIVILLITFGIKILGPTQNAEEDAMTVGESVKVATKRALQSLLGGYVDVEREPGASESLGGIIDGEYIPVEGNPSTIPGNITGGATEIIQTGAEVAYDEGPKKTVTIGSKEYETEDMEWKVLDVEGDKVKLISTKPITKKYSVGGNRMWLNEGQEINDLCNELYANGAGVTARSLNLADIDKLADITEEKKKELNPEYGIWYRYKYDESIEKVKSWSSTDYNPETKEGTWIDTGARHKGHWRIGENPTDALAINGTRYHITEAYSKTDYYSYNINVQDVPMEIKGGTILATRYIDNVRTEKTKSCYESFGLYKIEKDSSKYMIKKYEINISFDGWGSGWSSEMYIHPVVILPARALTQKVDGLWKVDL